jgi:hypothetical protein
VPTGRKEEVRDERDEQQRAVREARHGVRARFRPAAAMVLLADCRVGGRRAHWAGPWRQPRPVRHSLRSGRFLLLGKPARAPSPPLTPRPALAEPTGYAVVNAGSAPLALDTRAERIGTVIWATGFGPDLDRLDAPLLARDGSVAHRRGLTALPGLYIVGYPWLSTRGSGIL